MDLLIEILLDVYMELMLLIVPEKNVTKKHIVFAKVFAVLMLIAVFALAFWGIVWIVDYGNLWGILPLSVAILISLFQIIVGILFFKKNH